jgi:hypothetical protein
MNPFELNKTLRWNKLREVGFWESIRLSLISLLIGLTFLSEALPIAQLPPWT